METTIMGSSSLCEGFRAQGVYWDSTRFSNNTLPALKQR